MYCTFASRIDFFFEERYQSKWATNFKILIYKALEVKKNLTPQEYEKPTIKRNEILLELKVLLQDHVPKEQKDLCDFHKRMTKYEDYIFTFLFYQYVPPDNNGSERAIRNVKQKISGQFKTERGAQIYAIIRSVTETCIKKEQNILSAFKTIAKLQAE